MIKRKRPIYLDFQATTPLDKRVFAKMQKFFLEEFGNPHSDEHIYGWIAQNAIEDARKKIADLISAKPNEILFTSSATEANNLAVQGIAEYYLGKKNHIITLKTEHSAVIEPCKYLETFSFEVTYLDVKSDGLVDLDLLENSIRPDTFLISAMAINNEIGVMQDLAAIGAICNNHGVYFHTDAAQAFGKILIDVDQMNIDLLSISGHKIYGPKGIGALYARKSPKKVHLVPQIIGGGQEQNLRSGTLSTPLVVGLGEAAVIAKNEMQQNSEYIKKLQEKLYRAIVNNLPNAILNGSYVKRYPGNLNFSFKGVDGSLLMSKLSRKLALSSSSACSSNSTAPSSVLTAIGLEKNLIKSSIRIGISHLTTEDEIDSAADIIIHTVRELM